MVYIYQYYVNQYLCFTVFTSNMAYLLYLIRLTSFLSLFTLLVMLTYTDALPLSLLPTLTVCTSNVMCFSSSQSQNFCTIWYILFILCRIIIFLNKPVEINMIYRCAGSTRASLPWIDPCRSTGQIVDSPEIDLCTLKIYKTSQRLII